MFEVGGGSKEREFYEKWHGGMGSTDGIVKAVATMDDSVRAEVLAALQKQEEEFALGDRLFEQKGELANAAGSAAAANLATAFVVSAVASASETTTDTTQVHKVIWKGCAQYAAAAP